MTLKELKNEIGKKVEAAKVKALNTINWMTDNPEATVAIAALTGKALWEAGRYAKRKQINDQEKRRRQQIYDPEVGCRWKLRREMNNREAREYRDRIMRGESRYDILYDMGLLKR